ncbi:hypothetical protein AVEN_111631-1 [Araneus ventricosus]|uniref:Uncharacterized protein n=1 Tax=Araneus ventricosus TaxID=182803 RepID=A0A4Y2C213_ARAVE|nr:hypothetical protein AVEN_111631-1 [Araneus ventricosus]
MLLPGQVAISEDSEEEIGEEDVISEEEDATSEEEDATSEEEDTISEEEDISEEESQEGSQKNSNLSATLPKGSTLVMETFVTTLYPCRRKGFQNLLDKLSLLSGLLLTLQFTITTFLIEHLVSSSILERNISTCPVAVHLVALHLGHLGTSGSSDFAWDFRRVPAFLWPDS